MSDAPNEKGHMCRCKHCGNYTLVKMLWEESYMDYVLNFTNEGQIFWRLYRCEVCNKITFEETLVYEDEFGTTQFEEKIYYPITKSFSSSLPVAVNYEYEAALEVKPVNPNAFAVLVGRTLEAACNHENAQGRNLAQKLDYLVQKARIPNTLAEMAEQVRLLRNLAAHDAGDEVTVDDVPIILEFLEAILEYLYVAPAKIKAVQKRLTRLTPP